MGAGANARADGSLDAGERGGLLVSDPIDGVPLPWRPKTSAYGTNEGEDVYGDLKQWLGGKRTMSASDWEDAGAMSPGGEAMGAREGCKYGNGWQTQRGSAHKKLCYEKRDAMVARAVQRFKRQTTSIPAHTNDIPLFSTQELPKHAQFRRDSGTSCTEVPPAIESMLVPQTAA